MGKLLGLSVLMLLLLPVASAVTGEDDSFSQLEPPAQIVVAAL